MKYNIKLLKLMVIILLIIILSIIVWNYIPKLNKLIVNKDCIDNNKCICEEYKFCLCVDGNGKDCIYEYDKINSCVNGRDDIIYPNRGEKGNLTAYPKVCTEYRYKTEEEKQEVIKLKEREDLIQSFLKENSIPSTDFPIECGIYCKFDNNTFNYIIKYDILEKDELLYVPFEPYIDNENCEIVDCIKFPKVNQ